MKKKQKIEYSNQISLDWLQSLKENWENDPKLYSKSDVIDLITTEHYKQLFQRALEIKN